MKFGRYWFTIILFLLAWGATFTVRTLVCQRDIAGIQRETGKDFTPFLVESSIMYSYVLASAYEGGIPEYDPGLAEMQEVPLSQQMPIGLEPFLGWGLRVKNALGLKTADADFVRLQARLWVSLGGGFLLLWLLALRVPWGWSLFGALIYALSPAAVARATGQDLLCEVMALPFLIAAFAFGASYLRRPGAIKAIVFMIAVFGAVAFWDISQFVFAVWAVLEMIRSLIDHKPRRKRLYFTMFFYVVLVMAAILVPYHRAHGLILSPMFLVIFPVIIIRHLQPRRIPALVALILLALIWFGISRNSVFSSNYEHFRELIIAKIRYLNIKPEDPSKLSFAARCLWTPALHSADFLQVRYNFPAALWMTGILFAVGLCFRNIRRRYRYPMYQLPMILTAVFFVIFIFLFRFHVLAVIFMSVSCAMLFSFININLNKLLRFILILFALGVLFIEGRTLYRLQRSYSGFSLKEITGMLQYLKDSDVKDRVFLSTMEMSPLLKAYAQTAIVVQPKFEFPATREIFRNYVDSLFSADPNDFVKFCNRYHVDFFVYFQNTALSPLHIYSYRYMAAKTRIPPTCTALQMDTNPGKLNQFYELTIPKKYGAAERFRLFRFIKDSDIRRSKELTELALENWHGGNKLLARRLIGAAFLLNPKSEETYLAYYQILDQIPQAELPDFLKIPKS